MDPVSEVEKVKAETGCVVRDRDPSHPNFPSQS
jgi:hypothetical protein